MYLTAEEYEQLMSLFGNCVATSDIKNVIKIVTIYKLVYMQTGHPLFADQPVPFKALCELWASEGFQERSKKHRNVGTKDASHTLGGDEYRRMAQRTEEYGKEMERRHGEGFN
ncbi:hypothetical protein U9M48_004394 [Paspalum notatum var. saurae]|uniref:Uncharacterized protein n=1 Tax=Paspalum notatum var. saurae TaxID=547442 RepID=A0AAQ3PPZ3_PASNO